MEQIKTEQENSLFIQGEVKGHPSSPQKLLPVSGVDPAGATVNVVNVVNLSIEVSGFLPTLR